MHGRFPVVFSSKFMSFQIKTLKLIVWDFFVPIQSIRSAKVFVNVIAAFVIRAYNKSDQGRSDSCFDLYFSHTTSCIIV